MHVELSALPVRHLFDEFPPPRADTSASVAARVAIARDTQMRRQGTLNARLAPAQVAAVCRLDRESRALIATAITRLGLSTRAFHRVLKVARTCADLDGCTEIRCTDVSEAVKLRTLDRLTC